MQFKRLAITLLSIFAASSLVHAGTPAECKKGLEEARSSLVTLLNDATKRGADQQKIVSDTANSMSTCLSGMKVAGKDTEVAELQKVWGDFKKTRETELVPLILTGKPQDQEKAKTIATGIQKERMDKMNSIFKKLMGGDL